jgi:hypothetical protein
LAGSKSLTVGAGGFKVTTTVEPGDVVFIEVHVQ